MTAIRHVGMVVSFLAPAGGIEQSLITLIAELKRRGCRVWLYSCGPAKADNQYVKALSELGVPIISPPLPVAWPANASAQARDRLATCFVISVLPILGALSLIDALVLHRPWRRSWAGALGKANAMVANNGIYDWLRYWKLRQVMRQARPDIVHVHGWGGGQNPPGGIAAARRGMVPVIYTEHGAPWIELRDAPEITRDLRHAQVLIAISEDAAAGLREHCMAENEIRTIRHIVTGPSSTGKANPAHELSATKDQPSLTPTVTTVAMLRPNKGHDILLAAAALVLCNHPGTRFILVGDGSQRQALEAQCRALGVEKNVVFKGTLPHAQVEDILAQSDVFVLPSLHEPLGIAVIEAMAWGLPLIATAAGGILDLVQDGYNGLLVPPGDVASLAQALDGLLSDSELRSRLAGAARRSYLQGPFTPSAVGDSTLAAYKRALDLACNFPDRADIK
jgi:glycosyltransferase involved in cell wall biosynthesis